MWQGFGGLGMAWCHAVKSLGLVAQVSAALLPFCSLPGLVKKHQVTKGSLYVTGDVKPTTNISTSSPQLPLFSSKDQDNTSHGNGTTTVRSFLFEISAPPPHVSFTGDCMTIPYKLSSISCYPKQHMADKKSLPRPR